MEHHTCGAAGANNNNNNSNNSNNSNWREVVSAGKGGYNLVLSAGSHNQSGGVMTGRSVGRTVGGGGRPIHRENQRAEWLSPPIRPACSSAMRVRCGRPMHIRAADH